MDNKMNITNTIEDAAGMFNKGAELKVLGVNNDAVTELSKEVKNENSQGETVGIPAYGVESEQMVPVTPDTFSEENNSVVSAAEAFMNSEENSDLFVPNNPMGSIVPEPAVAPEPVAPVVTETPMPTMNAETVAPEPAVAPEPVAPVAAETPLDNNGTFELTDEDMKVISEAMADAGIAKMKEILSDREVKKPVEVNSSLAEVVPFQPTPVSEYSDINNYLDNPMSRAA